MSKGNKSLFLFLVHPDLTPFDRAIKQNIFELNCPKEEPVCRLTSKLHVRAERHETFVDETCFASRHSHINPLHRYIGGRGYFT